MKADFRGKFLARLKAQKRASAQLRIAQAIGGARRIRFDSDEAPATVPGRVGGSAELIP